VRSALGATSRTGVAIRRAPGALFAARTGPSDRVKADCAAETTEAGLFAALARLDNLRELTSACGGARAPRGGSHARTLSDLFHGEGDAGVARCVGPFAFASWDVAARRLTLGRDCMGDIPLFLHRTKDAAAFSTSLRVLLALPGTPRELDEEMLAQFLALNHAFPRRTLYKGIERIPGRTLASIDSGGAHRRVYWSPSPDAAAGCRTLADYVERGRALFDQAVEAVTGDCGDVAIATSGGLDSSAVAASVAQLGRADRITCYTLVPPSGFDVDVGPYRYADERDKVAALARMHPALDVRLVAPEKSHAVVEHDARYFARTHLPTLGPTVLGWTSFLTDEVERGGHPLLLGGGMGNWGLSWGGDLSLPALLATGDLSGFAREFVALARETERSWPQTLASDLVWPIAPRWARRLGHRLRGRGPVDVTRYSAVSPDYVAQHGLDRGWAEQGFDPWFQVKGWDAAAFRAHYLFDRRPPHVDAPPWLDDGCSFDQRNPHTDRRVLEFALAVPERFYRRGGVARSFARALFADRLPVEILQERRRGAGGGDWFANLTARRAAIAADIERLDGSPMARRLIDLPRLRRLVADWPADAAAAQARLEDYRLALTRAVHVGAFIRWVEGGNG